MKVKFTDVGGSKKSWEATYKDELTYTFLYKQVKRNAAIMSNEISFTEYGEIVAGIRVVGKYEVIE